LKYKVIRSFSFFAAAIALTAFVTFAQQATAAPQPSNKAEALYGTNLKFGMTAEQIEQVLHAHIKHGDPHTYNEYTVPDGTYLGLPGNYLFQFSSLGRLTNITLFIKEPEDASEQETFAAMPSGFIKQYGEPVAVRHSVREGGVKVLLYVWTTVDTEVSYELGPSTFMHGITALVIAQPRVTSDATITVSAKTLASLAPGGIVTVRWAGIPVAVIRRSTAELAKLTAASEKRSDEKADDPGFMVTLMDYGSPVSDASTLAHPEYRSIRTDLGVFVNIDTNSGCTLKYLDLSKDANVNLPNVSFGFYDPCHGNAFDQAGRPLRPQSAADPLIIPKYHYEANGDLIIGR
jgi:ubiquinol-cytochrome c reductase iron-sulfur subunit